MRGRLGAVVATVLTLALVGGCASKKPAIGTPVVATIAVVPATDPALLTLRNENGVVFLSPITSAGFYLDSKEKAKQFIAAMASRRMPLADKLTRKVVAVIAAKGFRIDVLTDVPRPQDDPDDVDDGKLRTQADAILQLRVDELGVFSSKFSTDYLPRVNIQAKLYVRSVDDSVYDENLSFGVDARAGDTFSIVSDPRFAYPTFESLLGRADEIAAVLDNGIDALAELVAAQLIDALAVKTRRPVP